MALDLQVIHEALANQIRNTDIKNTFNVFAFSEPGGTSPKIEVRPGIEYLEYFTTFGPDGTADLMLDLIVDLRGMTGEDRALWAWRLLSSGTSDGGSPQPTSLVDAVMSDKTLGGTVQDAVIMSAAWDDDNDQITAPVRIILKKSGAAV